MPEQTESKINAMPQYLLKALCHLEPFHREQLVVAERANVLAQFALELCNAILARGVGVWRRILSASRKLEFRQRHATKHKSKKSRTS
jgi:hypothetical protein